MTWLVLLTCNWCASRVPRLAVLVIKGARTLAVCEECLRGFCHEE